jgi:hypothetical protein
MAARRKVTRIGNSTLAHDRPAASRRDGAGLLP